jgi:Icc-related predicted phosphoesterase
MGVMRNKMEITFISDTHEDFMKLDNHPLLQEDCDIVIHCGDTVEDFRKVGKKKEFLEFLEWFSNLPAKHKVFIAGNHDFQLERDIVELRSILEYKREMNNVHYLENSSVVINGLKIYGTPIQPDFHSYAFNVNSEKEREQIFNMIPDDTNILVTHTPPFDVLDELEVVEYHPYTNARTEKMVKTGCVALKNVVDRKFAYRKDSPLLFHVFGHIHVHGGKVEKMNEQGYYVNAALACERSPYRIIGQPVRMTI